MYARVVLIVTTSMSLLTIQQDLGAQTLVTVPGGANESASRDVPASGAVAFAGFSTPYHGGPYESEHPNVKCNYSPKYGHDGSCGRECLYAGDFPGAFLVPGTCTSLKFGGYTKFDLIRDFDAIGNTDKFDTTTIPTNGMRHQNWRLHARQTRLNMDLRSQTEIGDARGFIEGDFFGSGNTFQLRHAYAEVGPVLAGQTWTTFMDEATLPAILDYENPIGMMFNRRAMLRWTQSLGLLDGLEYALAIEDPSPVFSSAAGIYESELPDFVGRLRYKHDRFHLQAAGFSSRASFTPAVGLPSDDNAWGFSFTGSVKAFEADKFTFQYSWGDGIEGFRGLQRFTLTPAGALAAVPSTAWMVTYQHQWCDRWKSSFVYSVVDVGNPSGTSTALKGTEYVSANILWKPVDQIQVGLEYLHGVRDDQDNNSGTANRLQFAVWYFLP
jgi:hypothetical protein